MDGCLNIVVSGEIDAGKSTLIGRFLHEAGAVPSEALKEIEETSRRLGRETEFAYLLDSFEEEREGQLTIDTTQTVFANPRGPDLLFIDVPGHAELLKNMLTGSSCADAALLVVDIRRAIEEGTRRHVRILEFLDVRHMTVALNKLDAVGYSEAAFREARGAIEEYFKGRGLTPEEIIPVSAKQGDNLLRRSKAMGWYRGRTLFGALNRIRPALPPRSRDAFCFPVQDTYWINGEGVCAGNVVSGSLRKGERVEASPDGRRLKVKKIHVFGAKPESVRSPEAVGVSVVPFGGVRRGTVLYKGFSPSLTSRFVARVLCMRPLSEGETLVAQCATQLRGARIAALRDVLEGADGRAAEAVIETDEPLAVTCHGSGLPLSRFVLRDASGICAAGIVVSGDGK